MPMKIAIITLNSAHNFGASLQAYALQKTLENLNFEVDIINYRYKRIDNIYNPYRRTKRGPLDVKFYLSRLKLHLLDRYKIRKYNNYEKFMAEYFNLTAPYKTINQLVDVEWDYDFYICGSDQIWNSHITRGLQPAYFLDFLPKNSKKIAYAASLGTDTIHEHDIPIFKKYLHHIDCISVRERSSIKAIKECTDKPIHVTADPTLLLKKEDYDKLKIDPKFKDKDYIFVYLIDRNEELYKIAEKISQQENLPVVFSSPYLPPEKVFKKQMGSVWDMGPREFLGVIANAKYVVTNSFHGNIFSILYQKPFISAPHFITSARVLEFLSAVNLKQVLFTDSKKFTSINDIEFDYEDVQKRVKDLKEKSINYLKKSLVGDVDRKPNYFEGNQEFTCYGCYACKEICPADAINMKEDYEGFVYPKIQEDKCNRCDMCKNHCIYSKDIIKDPNPIYPLVYAAYHKNKEIREISSSGGIFLPLASEFIDNGGYVVGVAYDSAMEPKYMIADTIEECKKFSGSKYVRSNIEGILPKIKELLDNDEIVLFSGVPCHVDGLKSYIGNENKNLYTAEILCHSNPSPKVFKKYIQYLEDKFKSKIVDFKFKNKSRGWNSPSVEIIFKNNKKIVENGRYNNYNRAFQIGLMARPCCYNCEFVKENRAGDITIGDFWGIEKIEPGWNDNKGTSLIIVNNDKGKLLLDRIMDKLVIIPKTMDEAFIKNHKWPITMKRERSEFFSKLEEENINDLLFSYNIPKQRLMGRKKSRFLSMVKKYF
ncbi:MAG: hypothetical protein Kow0019_19440 [Methanobacteriaceae archaeon]